jgi:hypothetical protein
VDIIISTTIIIVVVIFQGLGLLTCSISELIFLKFINLFGQFVGLPEQGFGPMQGLYLHRTTQHRKTQTYIHASSGIRSHDPRVRAAEDSTCLRPLGHLGPGPYWGSGGIAPRIL